MTRRIRTYNQTEASGGELADQVVAQVQRVERRLAGVRNIVVVASGKGGVGKSFIAANLAAAIAAKGYTTGALDADINGPSLALMLSAARAPLRVDLDGVHPAVGRNGCKVMSSDLLLSGASTPVNWREPAMGAFIWQSTLETGTLREFISDVAWGELDALVIDLPPGTDKIGRILSLLPRVDVLLLVTTPSRVTGAIVQRSLTQVRAAANVGGIGMVSNMATHVCPVCNSSSPLFPVDSFSDEVDEEVWGTIPFDSAASAYTDRGEALLAGSPVERAIDALAAKLLETLQPEIAR